MRVLLTYADRLYRYSQRLNRESAKQNCSFDEIWNWGPKDVSREFRNQNRELLKYKKGAGYWVWKPYIILKALEKLSDGDELFYCDSGALFIRDASQIFPLIQSHKREIFISSTRLPERNHTKRDAFVLLNCDSPEFADSPQRIASFLGFRNSEWVRSICSEWLHYCQDLRVVTDSENVMGLENFDGFKESKGDQSVLSLLSKKHNLVIFRDPSQYGNHDLGKYSNSPYEQFIEHTWLTPNKRLSFRIVNKILTVLEEIIGTRIS